MSTLQGRNETNTFGDLTHVENSNNGFDAILRVLESGNGNASSLSLSTLSAQFSGTLGVTGVATFDVTPNVNGDTMWHAGNDGPGSGLDADTVDGFEANTIPIGTRNVNVTGTWDWQNVLTFTRATNALIRRDLQSDGANHEMTARHIATEYQWYPSTAGDDAFTSRFGYEYASDVWRMGGEGLGLDNGSSINFRNAADNGFIPAFGIGVGDQLTVGNISNTVDIIGSSVLINGTSALSASANEVITGSWDYQQGVNNSTALAVTSTIVGQEYYLKFNVVTEGIRLLPGLTGDADYPDSEFKYNGDNDQWELGSGDGLLLKSLPAIHMENLAQTGSLTALSVGVGDVLQFGAVSTDALLRGSGVTVQSNSANVELLDSSAASAADFALQTADPTVAFSSIKIKDGTDVEVGAGSNVLLMRTVTGSITLDESDTNRAIRYTGVGGHTFTLEDATAIIDGFIVTIYNTTSNDLTIATNGVDDIIYFDGLGAGGQTATSFTLAGGSVATIVLEPSTDDYYLSGLGIS